MFSILVLCCYLMVLYLSGDVYEATDSNGSLIRIIKYDTYYAINDAIKPHIIQTKYTPEHQCKPSVYQIFRHDCCYSQFAVNYLYSLGFTEFDNKKSGSTVLWNKNKDHILGCYGLNIQQRNGTFADRFPLLHKTNIYRIIMLYCVEHKIEDECKYFLPQSYDLQKRIERIEFFKLLQCDNEANNEWLLKGNQHRGRSIKFIGNNNYVRYFYLNNNEQQLSNQNCMITDADVNHDEYKQFMKQFKLSKQVVAQKLVLNTLKIENCSFHIRTWVLLANYDDPLIVLYIDSVIHKAVDPNNLITNNAHDSSVKWSMKQFAEYFDTVNVTAVVEKIKNMLKITYAASFLEYNPSMKAITAQHHMLNAVDILLTDDLEIKLLEVNTKPMTRWIPRDCFEESNIWFTTKMMDKWQCKFGRAMMEEIIDIQLEIALKKSNGDEIENIDSLKSFQVVLWN